MAALLAIGLIIAVIALCAASFGYYQYVSSQVALNGFWHISGNCYLLIHDNMIRFVELTEGGTYSVIFEDKGADFTYKSIVGITNQRYRLTRSDAKSFSAKPILAPFQSKTIDLTLFSQIGVLLIKNGDKEIGRLVRDNEMSIHYASA